MSWDAANGVWLGDRARASAVALPSPLYLFGYGSLIWRSGDVLAGLKTYHCSCESWSRLFAQRSMDHRGRPAFPGLVLNLVRDDYLVESGNRSSDEKPSKCIGVVYHIPDETADGIIAELDFRERGGYERRVVSVQLLEDSALHQRGSRVDALVYVGPVDNPNFVHDTSASWYSRKAGIISAAFGPSGRNHDYLFPLVDFFRIHKYDDSYLFQLDAEIRMRLGKWRGRRHEDFSGAAPASLICADDPHPDGLKLAGWGSCEHGQLSPGSSFRSKMSHDNSCSALDIAVVMYSHPSEISRNEYMRTLVFCGGSHSACLIGDVLHLWGSQAQGQVGPGRIPSRVVGASLGHEHTLVLLASGLVLAFGEDSYCQCSGGSAAPDFLKYVSVWPFITLCNDLLSDVSPECSQEWDYFYNGMDKPSSSVVQVCAGVRHSVAITEDGYLHSWGGGRHASQLLSGSRWKPPGEMGSAVVDVALGLSHTVALDSTGRVWTWGGSNKHLQLGHPSQVDLGPSMILMSEGVIWQRVVSGWSHSAARGLKPDGSVVVFAWGRADMGNQATGSSNGLGSNEIQSQQPTMLPHLLPELPRHVATREIWCGSEFIIACSEDGYLWSSGWNEHGNLGIGSDVDIVNEWRPVVSSAGPAEFDVDTNLSRKEPTLFSKCIETSLDATTDATQSQLSSVVKASSCHPPSMQDQCRIAVIWDGALSCGGGHCLALLSS